MYFAVTLALVIIGAVAHVLLSGALHAGAPRVAEIALVWLVSGYYGVVLFNAGLQHLVHSDRIANYIGWPTGSGFQQELGWAEVGLGCAGFLGIWFRGLYLVGPAIVGSVLMLGAALVHARDMRRRGNFSGNARVVFYIDIAVPLAVTVALILYGPWAVPR